MSKDRPIPTSQGSVSHKLRTPNGIVYIHIVRDPETNLLKQVRVDNGKIHMDSSILGSFNELFCLALLKGATVQDLVSALEGHRSRDTAFDEGRKILSLPDGIAQVLKEEFGSKRLN